ncbi:MAG: hypothetical protein AAFV53_37825 [Myxococcota bacterium]
MWTSLSISPLYAVPVVYFLVEMVDYMRCAGVPYRLALFPLEPPEPLPDIPQNTPLEGRSPRIRYRTVDEAVHIRARGWVMLFGFFGVARIVPKAHGSAVFFSPFPSVASWVVSVMVNLLLFAVIGGQLTLFAFVLQLVVYFASVGTFFFCQRLFVSRVLLPDLERVLVEAARDTTR